MGRSSIRSKMLVESMSQSSFRVNVFSRMTRLWQRWPCLGWGPLYRLHLAKRLPQSLHSSTRDGRLQIHQCGNGSPVTASGAEKHGSLRKILRHSDLVKRASVTCFCDPSDHSK